MAAKAEYNFDDEAQVFFDTLLVAYEDRIRVDTAERLAADLGVWFEPDFYDPDVQEKYRALKEAEDATG